MNANHTLYQVMSKYNRFQTRYLKTDEEAGDRWVTDYDGNSPDAAINNFDSKVSKSINVSWILVGITAQGGVHEITSHLASGKQIDQIETEKVTTYPRFYQRHKMDEILSLPHGTFVYAPTVGVSNTHNQPATISIIEYMVGPHPRTKETILLWYSKIHGAWRPIHSVPKAIYTERSTAERHAKNAAEAMMKNLKAMLKSYGS